MILGGLVSRSVDYVALVVDVWLFMVIPTVFALTKSILPISQGTLACLCTRVLLIVLIQLVGGEVKAVNKSSCRLQGSSSACRQNPCSQHLFHPCSACMISSMSVLMSLWVAFYL
jgi:hypothetical protein